MSFIMRFIRKLVKKINACSFLFDRNLQSGLSHFHPAKNVPVTGLDCHFCFAKMYGSHQFLNWWQQHPTGVLHLDGFESGTITNKKEEALASSFLLVPVTGLEPVRHRWRRILSPLRLPFHHTGVVPI